VDIKKSGPPGLTMGGGSSPRSMQKEKGRLPGKAEKKPQSGEGAGGKHLLLRGTRKSRRNAHQLTKGGGEAGGQNSIKGYGWPVFKILRGGP